MLILRYSRKKDRHQYATVQGDPESIRDLYWQLTHNYKAQDGTEIGEINVTTLDGRLVSLTGPDSLMSNPHGQVQPACTLER